MAALPKVQQLKSRKENECLILDDYTFNSKSSWMPSLIKNMFQEYIRKFKLSGSVIQPTQINHTTHSLETESIRKPIHADWSWPRTKTERDQYKVFKDLWENGHYIGGGSKFGAEYLVYIGDSISPYFQLNSY